MMGLFFLLSCEPKKTELLWDQSFFQIGTQSSPRTADLNQDGVLDIVLGAGEGEVTPAEQGVIALDGRTGTLLWDQPTNASAVGSACFFDITGDQIPEVFIGGRDKLLKALNGQTGAVIWEYQYQYEQDPILQYARYNFYNSQLIPDQNQDGVPDLLTVNGGNWLAPPDSNQDRHPGVLMLLDLKTGAVLAADTMPDGKESYLSPLRYPSPDPGIQILFGSGGETAGGHLYLADLQNLRAGTLSQAQVLATEEEHGFIGPPVMADLNEDQYPEIIVVSHAGTVLALDGKTHTPLWQQDFPGWESSNSLAVGQFNEEETPDFFLTLSKGVWPDYTRSRQVMLDGKTGAIQYQDSLDCWDLTSPVVYDLNGDGIDEVILVNNVFDCGLVITEDVPSPPTIETRLVWIDLQKGSLQPIDRTKDFKNFFSTPWIGDLDQDGYLDIIYVQCFNPNELYRFLGMRVKRISTNIPMREEVRWGAYMGSEGNGVF